MQTYNRRTVTVVEPAVELPFGIVEMLEYLRAPDDDEAMIQSMMMAATDAMKRYLRRGILEEVVELVMDGFPRASEDDAARLGPGVHTAYLPSLLSSGGAIDLPYGPIGPLVEVFTTARNNVETEFDPALYWVDEPGARIVLAEGATWPTDLQSRAAVRIRYTIGSDYVPAPIVQGIKMHVAQMYECRSACDMPAGCKAMVAAYRRADLLGFT